jgi:isocitrate lyase
MSEGEPRVSEIWDSQEQFEAFGEHLMPILSDVGIGFSAEPEVFEVQNIVKR